MIITPAFIEGIASAITLVGVIWQMARWTTKVEGNTHATEKLTTTFDNFTDRVTGTLADHEVRIQINEHDIRQIQTKLE
jgi:hypothetical protein